MYGNRRQDQEEETRVSTKTGSKTSWSGGNLELALLFFKFVIVLNFFKRLFFCEPGVSLGREARLIYLYTV